MVLTTWAGLCCSICPAVYLRLLFSTNIFFHCQERRLADRGVVDSLGVKIGRVPWTRYVAGHQATCFFLTSPITTNYPASGCVGSGLRGNSFNLDFKSNWKIIAWLQWPHQPGNWWRVYKWPVEQEQAPNMLSDLLQYTEEFGVHKLPKLTKKLQKEANTRALRYYEGKA